MISVCIMSYRHKYYLYTKPVAMKYYQEIEKLFGSKDDIGIAGDLAHYLIVIAP